MGKLLDALFKGKKEEKGKYDEFSEETKKLLYEQKVKEINQTRRVELSSMLEHSGIDISVKPIVLEAMVQDPSFAPEIIEKLGRFSPIGQKRIAMPLKGMPKEKIRLYIEGL